MWLRCYKWTEKYTFIPPEGRMKSVCLSYSKTVTTVMSGNVNNTMATKMPVLNKITATTWWQKPAEIMSSYRRNIVESITKELVYFNIQLSIRHFNHTATHSLMKTFISVCVWPSHLFLCPNLRTPLPHTNVF